jgi:uncharacterized protein YecE (DUF72 family)
VSEHPVRIGCSGWQYQSWRGVLYPPGCPQPRWLQRYAELFDTVEVNSTFYRLASRDAVARWVEQTPEGFCFALKASRYLIHMRKLAGIEQGIERFYERIEPLVGTPKLGPVLWQLPEWFRRDDERLLGALELLPPGRHCFEFRHPSWYAEDVYALLRERGVALAIGDDPRRADVPLVLTAGWTLLRFHYGRRGRGGNYSPAEIDEWARRIARLARDVDVYAYYNNDWEGYAVRNALALRGRLAATASSRALAASAAASRR